jgi:hypothetical protein
MENLHNKFGCPSLQTFIFLFAIIAQWEACGVRMRLPKELLRQVTLGTFFESGSSSIETVDNELFHMLDSSADRPLEGRLLLQILAHNLQHQVGFVAGKLDAEIVEQAHIENRGSALKFEAVKHFIKMLAGGIDVELLPEWCRLVIKSKQYLPDEFAPTVMQLGNRLDTHRIFLRSVLSDKAIWLAKHSQFKVWQWVLTTAMLEGSDIDGIRYERERDLIALVWSTPPSEINENILPHFAIYLQPWSATLTEVFLRNVVEQRLMDSQHRFSYLDSLENFAYFAPLEFLHEIMPLLHVSPKDVNLSKRFEAIRRIMNLRHEIYDSIYSSKQS